MSTSYYAYPNLHKAYNYYNHIEAKLLSWLDRQTMPADTSDYNKA